MARPPRIPNWLPWHQRTVYFVTLCVDRRKPVLANERTWRLCLETLRRLDRWTLLAALLMPDHLHLLVAPENREGSLAEFSKWFKRWFHEDRRCSRQEPLNPDWEWQTGCFDRLLRSDESLSEKWTYIRENPVRAGLVADSTDWPYQYAINFDTGKR